MSVSTLQDDVYKGLQGLSSIDSARNLLAQLNYDYASAPLRTDIPQTTRDMLLTGPQVIAQHGDFKVIHTRFNADRLPLGHQRQIITRLLPDNPYSLFLFSDVNDSGWHFVNVRHEGDKATRTFRRISIGPDERIGDRLRTPAEQLSKIAVAGNESVPPLELQSQHDRAFDVDVVTKRFYERYRDVFHRVESQVQGIENADERRIFTQRLFNRLMFVAFIQKKGWLKLNGQTDYLNALWDHYQKSPHTNSFYSDRLKNLFFVALDNPDGRSYLDGPNGNLLHPFIGDVPYLNGGLFEQSDHDSRHDVDVPDTAIDDILSNLFNRFNFTITESTPLDQEVAVDPEMLGKVFEELVTGRHETGSYYTPKPIVSFMCREALKAYLRSNLPGESPEAIERFVDEHEPDDLRNFEAVLDALRKVTACDPACGSGAYILGLLHELLDLREALFKQRKIDYEAVYERKLEIIQNNLYGVDIDPFATNIARLRLWLSLAIDYQGEQPEPLPNLDFKIETGDSLSARHVGEAGQLGLRQEQIRQFQQLKVAYLTAHGDDKRRLSSEIAEARAKLQLLTHGGAPEQGFDWAVEFAEVFATGGFDVVLANPPYVRADARFQHISSKLGRERAVKDWQDYRSKLRAGKNFTTLAGKWDLYIPFLERSYSLLRPLGQMIHIIPDAVNSAAYAKASREFFIKQSKIVRIDFCSEIDLFDAGVQNTILHISKVPNSGSWQPIRVRRWGDIQSDFIRNYEYLVSGGQSHLGERLFRPDFAIDTTPQIKSVPMSDVCFISVGMVVNAHERYHHGAFSAEDVTSLIPSEIHTRRFVFGKDVSKWSLKQVRFLEWGTNRAPNHFRRKTFPELHEANVKLIAMRTPGAEPKLAFDTTSVHFDASSIGFVPWHSLTGVRNRSIVKTAKYRDEMRLDEVQALTSREQREELSVSFSPLYLLAIMNSSTASDLLRRVRRSKRHIYPDDWKDFPIPVAPASIMDQLAELATECINITQRERESRFTSSVELAEVEAEIDARVARLYGLPEPRKD